MGEQVLLVRHPFPNVMELVLNRPRQLNALSPALFDALTDTFTKLLSDEETHVVIFRGEGKHFCAGLDLKAAMSSLMPDRSDAARNSLQLRGVIERLQRPCALLAKLPQATIACVQGACIGGGVDLSAACDIRYCAADAKFSIKEVDVGITADLGSLHRMPLLTGNQSWVRELAFTGRQFDADEALRFGFVSHVAADEPAARDAVLALARTIASKSPVAVRGTKEMCEYAESHPPDECFTYVRTLNGAMLQSADLTESVQATFAKRKPEYSKL